LRISAVRRREAFVMGTRGRTVTLKMKLNDFKIITRSRSVPLAVATRRASASPSHSPPKEIETDEFGMPTDKQTNKTETVRDWIAFG
jgi:hypothetical protein